MTLAHSDLRREASKSDTNGDGAMSVLLNEFINWALSLKHRVFIVQNKADHIQTIPAKSNGYSHN